jgi:hypothetical protein
LSNVIPIELKAKTIMQRSDLSSERNRRNFFDEILNEGQSLKEVNDVNVFYNVMFQQVVEKLVDQMSQVNQMNEQILESLQNLTASQQQQQQQQQEACLTPTFSDIWYQIESKVRNTTISVPFLDFHNWSGIQYSGIVVSCLVTLCLSFGDKSFASFISKQSDVKIHWAMKFFLTSVWLLIKIDVVACLKKCKSNNNNNNNNSNSSNNKLNVTDLNIPLRDIKFGEFVNMMSAYNAGFNEPSDSLVNCNMSFSTPLSFSNIKQQQQQQQQQQKPQLCNNKQSVKNVSSKDNKRKPEPKSKKPEEEKIEVETLPTANDVIPPPLPPKLKHTNNHSVQTVQTVQTVEADIHQINIQVEPETETEAETFP